MTATETLSNLAPTTIPCGVEAFVARKLAETDDPMGQRSIRAAAEACFANCALHELVARGQTDFTTAQEQSDEGVQTCDIVGVQHGPTAAWADLTYAAQR